MSVSYTHLVIQCLIYGGIPFDFAVYCPCCRLNPYQAGILGDCSGRIFDGAEVAGHSDLAGQLRAIWKFHDFIHFFHPFFLILWFYILKKSLFGPDFSIFDSIFQVSSVI